MTTRSDTIVSARLKVLRVATGDGVAMSFAPLRHRSMVMVELRTDDGRIGHGESWTNFPAWAAAERVATLREGVFPLVVGRTARHITDIHRTLTKKLEPLGRQWGAPGPIMQAISAADMALWDLHGKDQGVPVSALLGGRVREQSPVYASSFGPASVAEQFAMRAAGKHTAVKVKLGFGRERDEGILAEIREAAGADITLYADANQAWSVGEATKMAALLKAFDVAWIEEPLRGNRLEDIEELHRRTGLTIATGENMYGREEFARYALSPAVAILQPDIAKTGGLTETLSICQVADAFRKPVLPHLYGGAIAFAATLQLAACVPAVREIEYDIRDNPLRDPLVVDPPTPSAGMIRLPDGPGLGIELEGAMVDKYTQSSEEYLEETLTALS
jgi:L-alanine-DL-glutamate epimerase-like enolase superfamily enzyme